MLTIGLGFVNPLISVAMVVLYYLPGIIQDICKPCSESQEEYEMNSFSDDVADSGANKVTYTIDENGYIQSLEGDGEYQ